MMRGMNRESRDAIGVGNWIWAGIIVVGWSALMFAGGWLARIALAPIEYRTERVYGAANSHAVFDEAWDRVKQNFIGTVPDRKSVV